MPAERAHESAFLREYQQYSRAARPALGPHTDAFLADAAVLLFTADLQPRLRAALARPGFDPAARDLWPTLAATPHAVPNALLCAHSGAGPRTLLHFATHHQFTAGEPTADRLGLHLLGRLFERAIPDRKRHGVHYTPQPAVEHIVKNCLGRRLAELRAAAGLDDAVTLPALAHYQHSLRALRILDPACGSGTFLLAALHHLARAHRWILGERARLTATAVPDLSLAALTTTLHGVDLDERALDLARRLLTIAAGPAARPTLLRGDALDPAFAWPHADYDVILGNPPYIKLQNLRRTAPALAAALPTYYETATTGNFDLYLPFLERSLALLAEDGHLGFVAPNTWPRNAHGAALRRQLHRTRRLTRWLDFNNYQLFPDATTYTALQFYRGRPVDEIHHLAAPDGDLDAVDWTAAHALPYADLPPDAPWQFLPRAESQLLNRLRRDHPTLEQTAPILVGVQTSADHIYHLERAADLHYHSAADPAPFPLEREILRPLLRGPDARRYRTPVATTHILFPYEDSPGRPPRLYTPDEMQRRFPHAWRYLLRHEPALRARERHGFDDPAWYRLGRQQNLGKQRRRKLGVAQTAPTLRVFHDLTGAFCFHNVRVNAVLLPDDDDETGWYLLGVLNGAVADFVFRRISRPKSGGYFEANKQFLAPLPVPRADPHARADIARRARELQALHDAHADARTLAAAELAMNEALFALHGLTPDERRLVAPLSSPPHPPA